MTFPDLDGSWCISNIDTTSLLPGCADSVISEHAPRYRIPKHNLQKELFIATEIQGIATCSAIARKGGFMAGCCSLGRISVMQRTKELTSFDFHSGPICITLSFGIYHFQMECVCPFHQVGQEKHRVVV